MKFLVFQHVPHETPGIFGKFAKENNIKLDIVEFWKPYEIPPVAEYKALIIMGGPMGVYEDEKTFPSKNSEIKSIKEALGKIPTIGFCLGGQLLAYALGADVHSNIKGGKKIKEVGYFDIELTKEGQKSPIFSGLAKNLKVLQWHGDVFDLPKDATLLATSSVCPNQAFSFQNAYGLLFHFEFTPDMVKRQIGIDRKWVHEDNDLDEAELMREAKKNATIMEKQAEKLFENFISLT